MTALQQQTAQSVRFNARLTTALGIAGRLLDVLAMIGTARAAMQLLREGTILGDAQRQADAIVDEARDAQRWVEETAAAISLSEATIVVGDAIARGDTEMLFDLSVTYGDVAAELLPAVETLDDLSTRLDARSQALLVVSDAYKRLAQVPIGISTAPQADAAAMYISLERLGNRVGTAATYYTEATSQLRFYQDFLEGLAYRANREAWRWQFADIGAYMRELRHQREAALGAERRIDLRLAIAEIESEAAEPVSRPQEEIDALFTQRETLRKELEQLERQRAGTRP